ncbi:UbiA-like polyprenyltransferase [Desulforhabdus amnigena]|jgi:4-hydroxybenzoate polyprenyltransferase|uniref:4-hydroxybenzoate polyprenyltransferase n=1 Tax=Desulforhabdus amnigena TaxID=40218 RepID=A0A9W6CYX2_9BACT|nr:UbiA-like polyprenyltransferase [Desulforhabdus amnigena]NLJ29379.1 UbiA family prenyltransferase [Deltaproteobacteria bacterium]GLI34351.1 4-hydroxybenzoate octaprenyltransferase [Desulforhabdus amnigena]
MWLERIQTYGRLIKFSHTVFALPFALAAALLANRQHPMTWFNLGCIILAMAAARSAAMGFNRFADYEYDRRNPRTVERPLTSGKIDKQSVLLFITISSAIFILTAAILGRLCLVLSVPVLLILFSYSYTKRFTAFAHLFLGFAIGLAPLGAWIAITGAWDSRILLLSMALMTYIAGFDILYACQDVEFDREQNLFSIPSRWGVHRAFKISAFLHVLTFLFLFSVYFVFDLGFIYLAFLACISFLLILEHRLVRPDHLEKIDLAFFHVNSAVSVLLFVAVLADTWLS